MPTHCQFTIKFYTNDCLCHLRTNLRINECEKVKQCLIIKGLGLGLSLPVN